MNKQYIFGLLAVLVIAMFSVSLALAQENETNGSDGLSGNISINSTVDDIVPSGFRYGWEKLKLNFVRNQTTKVEKELQLARWKIAEAKFKSKNGNFDGADKAMEDHDRLITDVQARIEKMENKSLTPGLDRAIEVHEEKLANLKLLLESSNLTDKQRIKVDFRISKMENSTEHLSELRVKIGERREGQLAKFENRTTRIEDKGDRVRGRIDNKTISRNSSDDSEDNETEDDSDDSNSTRSSD